MRMQFTTVLLLVLSAALLLCSFKAFGTPTDGMDAAPPPYSAEVITEDVNPRDFEVRIHLNGAEIGGIFLDDADRDTEVDCRFMPSPETAEEMRRITDRYESLTRGAWRAAMAEAMKKNIAEDPGISPEKRSDLRIRARNMNAVMEVGIHLNIRFIRRLIAISDSERCRDGAAGE